MAKKKKTKKSAPVSAEEIKRLEAEKASKTPIMLVPLSRSVEEIVRDRVTMMHDSIGIELHKDTTLEESLAILDYAQSASDHVGFWIGDVLNFSNAKFGEKYTQALNQTGRALSTLKGYAETAKRIPANKRVALLTFTHHRELIRLPEGKLETALVEVGKQAEKAAKTGEGWPSVQEVRTKVTQLTPRKKKAPKKATSGKSKKGGKKAVEAPPYQPSDEEQAKLDAAEEALSGATDAVKSAKLYQIVGRLDNKEKKRWLALALPIVDFYNAVDRVTGY